MSTINKKQDLLLDSISSFYLKNPDNMDKLIKVLDGEYASLRLIDWFATNYSKKNEIKYQLDDGSYFKVFKNYKEQLSSYSKKLFDPFNRTERIKFYYQTDKYVKTTVCQLNFFRWAIENNVLQYIKDHCDEIEQDMNNNVNYVYKKEEGKRERKKRKELSVSANKFLSKSEITLTVKFN